MDSGISTVRNLLYIVLVLALLSIVANIYVGTQLSQNSEELSRLGLLLQKQLMTSGIEQSQQIQQKMDEANRQMAGMDQKLKNAQDDMVKRMNVELPPLINRTMDNYIRTRAPQIEKQAMKQIPR
jgi:MarR-like DNA-binding transcriptional regulator SgrR of sgrS sRNA